MGQGQSLQYSVEVPGQEQPQNSTKVRRHPNFVDGLVDSPDSELKTLQLILQKSFRTFASNDCVGEIITPPVKEGEKELRKVQYKSYKEVYQITETLDRAVHDMNLAPEIEEVPGLKLRFIGIFSKNRAEWLEVDVMTILRGYCLVPIYDTLGAQNIPYVLNHTNMTTLFCSAASLDVLLKCSDLGRVKTIITFDPVEDEILDKFRQKGLSVELYSHILKKYERSDIRTKPKILKPEDVVAFCYTSGTTGAPKGAMHSQKNFAAYAGVLKNNPQLGVSEGDTHLSYLPLAHVLENICVLAMLVFGGRICCYSGDVKNLKNDLELVKPSIFVSVPRLYNRFYDAIKEKFEKTEGWSKTVLDKALSSKMETVHTTGGYTHRLYDKVVFNNTKQLFGGQCRLLASGSAPLNPEVQSFMKVIACVPFLQGYGPTESTGVNFLSAAIDPQVGHVGGPTSMIEYKLLDIPEMHYTHDDKDEQGRSVPRGEILMRGPGVFLGYYKDEEKTKEAIDQDGWLHTGDVGAITPDTKALKIIDRKKNIFKLQQGEYVASERVEAVYTKREDMVQQMFLYGDSTQNYCVGIITPVRSAIETIAKNKNIQGSYEQQLKNKEVRGEFLRQLNTHAKQQGLHGFQQPKNVYLEGKGFQETGVLTTTMKLQRFTAKNHYKEEIQGMYKEGMFDKKAE